MRKVEIRFKCTFLTKNLLEILISDVINTGTGGLFQARPINSTQTKCCKMV